MIPTHPFGRTGHDSTRIIFGAAALGGMRQERADRTLDLIHSAGINHIDTAATYGDSELRLADFLQSHRDEFFLATKTGERDGAGARASIERSLVRMQVETLDLIQFHNLAQDDQWDTAMGPGGCLEAAIQAREEGLVRHIGVTGHGTRIAEMHLKSLDRFEFASVLLPYNFMMLQEDRYREEFDRLYALCRDRGIAMQTIKSIAKRRWRQDDPGPRFSWYAPYRDEGAIERAVHFVLSRDGLFLNSTSDATLLPRIFAAVDSFDAEIGEDMLGMLAADNAVEGEPLFVRGISDDVRI